MDVLSSKEDLSKRYALKIWVLFLERRMKIHIVQIPICGRGIGWNTMFEFGFFLKSGNQTTIYRPIEPGTYREGFPSFTTSTPKGFEFIGVSI